MPECISTTESVCGSAADLLMSLLSQECIANKLPILWMDYIVLF